MPSKRQAGGPLAPLIRALVAIAHEVRDRVPPGLGPDDAAAQSVACAVPLAQLHRQELERALPWLHAQLSDWEQWSLQESLRDSHPLAPNCALHLYDTFLHAWQRDRRQRSGVFFTPQPIADYLIAQIDRTLRAEFALPQGIAAESEIHFLDPALGTGVFLLTVLDRIHRQLTDQWSAAGHDESARRRLWNAFVPRLLPRLAGIEILPPAALLAKLNLAIKLAQTGYDFAAPTPLNITCGDALQEKSKIRNPKSEIMIVLGNPPYSALSTSANPWISRLVRGDDEIRGYVCASDERLGERKT
ncbi:MAG: N-6 DNA methylase, partial [Pirellulaceae bacterium]|nr:N-6 DNA methylase [Pirellulaceae bacterium]